MVEIVLDAGERNRRPLRERLCYCKGGVAKFRVWHHAVDETQRLASPGVDRLLEIERERGKSLKIEDIHDQVAGVYPKVMIDGDMDAGAWSCGMVAGLIHDIPTVKELIDRIMAEAERLILERLAGLVGVESRVALKVA